MPQARHSHKPLWKTFLQVAAALVLPVFLVLKLTSAVGWSWWWVMAPLWVTLLMAVLIGLLAAAAFTLLRWFLMARAWLRFRRSLLPELALADPTILSRIEAASRRAGDPAFQGGFAAPSTPLRGETPLRPPSPGEPGTDRRAPGASRLPG
jgi:hypothetical protein